MSDSRVRLESYDADEAPPSETSAGGVVLRLAPTSGEEGAERLEVLLGEQRDWNSGKLGWRLPKGHLEEGESLEEAAVREVLEETGLRAEIQRALPPVRYRYFNRKSGERIDKGVHFFVMSPTSAAPEARDEEMERIEWMSAERALAELRFETEREVLRSALAFAREARPRQEP